MLISPRIKWYLIVTAIVLVFLLSIPLLIMATGKRAFDRELAAWQAIGGKARFAELVPAAVPDEENAAILYLEAASDLNALFGGANSEWIGGPSEDPDLAAHIETCAELFDKIYRASEMEQCAWPIDFDVSPAEVLNFDQSHLYPVRLEAKLLRAQMMNFLNHDDPASAMETTRVIMKLAGHIEKDPTLIGVLLSIAIRNLAVEQFQDAFRHRELPSGILASDFDALDFRSSFRQALVFEGTATANLLADPQGATALGVPTGRVWYPIIRHHAAAQYLARLRPIISACAKPYWEGGPLEMPATSYSPWGAIADLAIPAFDRVNESIMRIEVKLALARQAILLRQHRDQHGTYPDPAAYETLTDPRAGEPLPYELTATGFTLKVGLVDGRGDSLDWAWD